MTNEQTAYLNYATTLSKIITHTDEGNNFTPISEDEFKKLEKKTQEALTKYAELKGGKFDKYVEKPKNYGEIYLVKDGYIILESNDFNLVMDATDENSVNGLLIQKGCICGWTW